MAATNPAPASAGAANWRKLYRTALFESDKQQLISRISEAEKAIIQRGRELFAAHDQSEERDALDDALYALRAMRNCVKLKTTDPGGSLESNRSLSFGVFQRKNAHQLKADKQY
jgi:hypothetical protein